MSSHGLGLRNGPHEWREESVSSDETIEKNCLASSSPLARKVWNPLRRTLRVGGGATLPDQPPRILLYSCLYGQGTSFQRPRKSNLPPCLPLLDRGRSFLYHYHVGEVFRDHLLLSKMRKKVRAEGSTRLSLRLPRLPFRRVSKQPEHPTTVSRLGSRRTQTPDKDSALLCLSKIFLRIGLPAAPRVWSRPHLCQV